MTTQELVDAIRDAQQRGCKSIDGTLVSLYRGCRRVTLDNLNGHINGNPHDVWVCSRSGSKTLGRIYLGSKRTKGRPDTKGWESLIAAIG